MQLSHLIDIALHLDRYVPVWADEIGAWLYVVLFAVIFCETGLVVTPFLPGDSLLFAVGAVAALGNSSISLPVMALALCAAAILGNVVNYSIGRYVGPHVLTSETSRLLNKRYLTRAHEFYEKYGGRAIVMARFVPIVRTFAPFVAGIAQMSYARYTLYNVIGSVAWVLLLMLGGYAFGRRPWVKAHFSVVEIAIIVISIMPIVVEWLKVWISKRAGRSAVGAVEG